MIWFASHWKAFCLALARLAGSPLNTLLSALGIGIALALPSGGHLLLDHAQNLGRGAAPGLQITVFMEVKANREATREIEERLKRHPAVATTELLQREATFERMRDTRDMGDVLSALPENPFPDAIVVTPTDESPATLEALATQVRQWPHVEHVQVDTDWAQRLAALVRLAGTGVTLLAVLLGLGLVTITFNLIRLQVLTRRDEIELSRLLGATDAFIRRPFLWYGALLGLAGGLVGWLLVALGMMWLRLPVAELARLYGLDLMLTLPSLAQSAILLGIASLLGWMGAALSMRRQVRYGQED